MSIIIKMSAAAELSAFEPTAVCALSALHPRTPAAIAQVSEAGPLGERLLEMGLTPGAIVEVIRRGFLGAPMMLRVRGYILSIRRDQAHNITVEPRRTS